MDCQHQAKLAPWLHHHLLRLPLFVVQRCRPPRVGCGGRELLADYPRTTHEMSVFLDIDIGDADQQAAETAGARMYINTRRQFVCAVRSSRSAMRGFVGPRMALRCV